MAEASRRMQPCPFCGSGIITWNKVCDIVSINCMGCNAHVTAFQPNALNDAIIAWNNRAPQSANQDETWKPTSRAPCKPGSYINVRDLGVTTYRWKAYKPGAPQLKFGVLGRWQRATEYGWENAKLPPKGEFVICPDATSAPVVSDGGIAS